MYVAFTGIRDEKIDDTYLSRFIIYRDMNVRLQYTI